ncbi:hypothetical protein Desgi_0785 [Desulfoscipio gibsoniae DSM 7213]|uniref:Uncharacterized protein n=1 Tax=Desulfoscipio gibsoniae DSM 7213 TaxID=767817 RepID=R4KF95_9FIRM|nr:hypothetical protein Desgi_0785 [Desulfoscipio gibsoniae DSM 7213]
MSRRIINAPCENCHYKNGIECFNVLAMIKTARAMEMELYNHGVESLVPNFTIPCENYASEKVLMHPKLKKKIV